VLEHGRLADVSWIIDAYGLRRIHEYFREEGSPELSARTVGFWRAVFQAENETWQSPPEFRTSSFASFPR
jgi:hypothetical protein